MTRNKLTKPVSIMATLLAVGIIAGCDNKEENIPEPVAETATESPVEPTNTDDTTAPTNDTPTNDTVDRAKTTANTEENVAPVQDSGGVELIESNAQNTPSNNGGFNTIESTLGPKGSTVHLTDVKVIGKILTVKLVVEPKKGADGNYEYSGSIRIPAENLSYINDSTSKKVSVLKDEQGSYMITPMDVSSSGYRLDIPSSVDPVPVSIKFPAPEVETTSISLSLGELATFDGVPLSQ